MRTFFQGIEWKHRLVGAILLMAAALLSLSLFTAYRIFMDKLEENSRNMTTLSFQQTELNLSRKLQAAEREANTLLIRQSCADFLAEKPGDLPQTTARLREVLTEIDGAFSQNQDLYSICAVSTSGQLIGATKQGKTLYTSLSAGSSTDTLLRGSRAQYPFFCWHGSAQLQKSIPENVPFSLFLSAHDYSDGSSAVLLGVRAVLLGDSQSPSFLVAALRERDIRECYSQVLYNQNTAMLVDSSGTILSCTSPELLGQQLPCMAALPQNQSGSFSWNGSQIIYYALPQYGWTLINQIPETAYQAQAHEIRMVIWAVGIVTMLLLLLFFCLWTHQYTRPIDDLMRNMQQVALGDLRAPAFKKSGIPELDRLNQQFSTTVHRLDTLMEQVKRIDEEKRAEELLALQYQINPHFLYNSINAISWQAIANGNQKVADSLSLLARIITPILRSPSFFWTVQEEIQFVDSYVKMLMLRFGGRIDYRLDCDKALHGLEFPRFTLQPIIENCFTHGMIAGQALAIRIRIAREGNHFHITVSNSGAPVPPDRLAALNDALRRKEALRPDGERSSGSIGLSNVNKRLKLLYGEESSIWIASGEGTVVHLLFGS